MNPSDYKSRKCRKIYGKVKKNKKSTALFS
jgi:hypothetical protein